MDNKTIFVVTVFEMPESNDELYGDIGCTRSPCFTHTFKEAERVVINNMGDIRETCYDYAVIEKIGSELYPRYRMRKFYKYNTDLHGYEPIEEPECLKRVLFCGIG